MSWLMSSATDWTEVLAFLADSAVKGSVVLLVAAGVAWLLRRGSAAARHTVWSAAIAAQLMIPVLSLLLPTWRIALTDAPVWIESPRAMATPVSGITSAPPTTRTEPLAPKPDAAAPQSSGPATSPAVSTPVAASSVSPLAIVIAVWLLGCIVVLGRLAAGTAIVSRMAVRGERVVDEKWLGLMHRLAVALGIDRPLTLLRGDALGVPVTWGIVYPVVFLPSDADTWSEERRRYVLVHEMAHVKRLDAFTQLVAQFALAIFWFNPLVWIAAARMRRERENACDDYVLAHGTKPSEYASDLLEIVRNIGSRGQRGAAPAFAALAMARRSEFEGRMLSILDPEVRRTALSRKGVLMSLVTAVLVIAPLAAFSPFKQATASIEPITPNGVSVGLEPPVKRIAPSAKTESSGPVSAAASAIVGAVGSAAQSTTTLSASLVSIVSGSAADPCDRQLGSTSSTNSTSIHENDDSPDSRSIKFLSITPTQCTEVVMLGNVKISDDEREVLILSPSGRARFREKTAAFDREVQFQDRLGEPFATVIYRLNGKLSQFDDAGRTWLAQLLPRVLRESGIDAEARVKRLQKAGGTNAVLEEIGLIKSTGGKRNYYEAFLDLNKTLSDVDMYRMLLQAQDDLQASSGDLRSVLQKVGRRAGQSRQVSGLFASAVATMTSDGDKASLITQVAMTADRGLLLEIMKAANTIDSDGDKSRFLISSAARYLGSSDSELRGLYFTVAESVESDGDLSRVLISAAAYGHADEKVTEAAIRGTHGMDSPGDQANVLISIASRRLLTTQKLKDAYMKAAEKVGSDGDRARVLRAAIGG